MKKKRFKKLLYSKGYQRNVVNKIVNETIKSGIPYAEVYKRYQMIPTIDVSHVTNAMDSLYKTVSRVVDALGEGFKAVTECFKKVMKGL